MAELKIAADAGGGWTSLKGPANTSNQNAFVLPSADGSAGQLLKTDGSKNLSFATVAGGLTVADQWRQTADWASSSTSPISANWEQVDQSGQGTIGSAMTESSGIFTFPSTGVYLVHFFAAYHVAGNTEVRYADMKIEATVNNSAYSQVAKVTQGQGHGGTGNNYVGNTAHSLVDVTSTSDVKVRFAVSAQASVTWLGNSGRNDTYATFLRLGDT